MILFETARMPISHRKLRRGEWYNETIVDNDLYSSEIARRDFRNIIHVQI